MPKLLRIKTGIGIDKKSFNRYVGIFKRVAYLLKVLLYMPEVIMLPAYWLTTGKELATTVG